MRSPFHTFTFAPFQTVALDLIWESGFSGCVLGRETNEGKGAEMYRERIRIRVGGARRAK